MIVSAVTFQALEKSETPSAVTSSCGDFAAIPVYSIRGEYDRQFRGIACVMLGQTHLFDQGFEAVISKAVDKLDAVRLHGPVLSLFEAMGLGCSPSHLTTADFLKSQGLLHDSVTDADLIRVWCERQINPFSHTNFVDGRGLPQAPSMKAERALLAWFKSFKSQKEAVCA